MAIQRTIKCAICGKTEAEKQLNYGFPGWVSIHSVVLNDEANPTFCPEHKIEIMNFVDKLAEGYRL